MKYIIAVSVMILFCPVVFAQSAQEKSNSDGGLTDVQLKALDKYPIENLSEKDFFKPDGSLYYYSLSDIPKDKRNIKEMKPAGATK